MKNTVIKGDGTSRKIKAPSDMPTTFGDWRAQLLAGSATFDIALNAGGCEAVGTPLSKANLLSDTTETALGLTSEEPTVDEALAAIGAALDEKAPTPIISTSAPNNQTAGAEGQLYLNRNGMDLYACLRALTSMPAYWWYKVITARDVDNVEVDTPSLRNEYFVAKADYTDSNAPTVEGQICWLYG